MKKKKYDLGSFVTKNASGIGTGLNVASSLLGTQNNPFKVNTGSTIAQGALSGAGALSSLGPWGMAIGAVGGAVGGIIGAGKKRRAAEEYSNQYISNSLNSVAQGMNTTNVDPYGTQMYEDGGKVMKKDTVTNVNGVQLVNGKFLVEKKDGSIGQWGNDIVPKTPAAPIGLPTIPLSDKALGGSSNYYPARGVQRGADVPVQKPSHPFYKNGGEVSSEENEINIEEGELLIDPDTGKILQEYSGINPLTGGKFQRHAKKGKDVKHNFTLADPGLFVINRPNAKKYKDSVDSNDKLSQKTILMNIQNNKISEDGGLEKMANGGAVEDPFAINGIKTMNVNQFNPAQPNYYPRTGYGDYSPNIPYNGTIANNGLINNASAIPATGSQIRPIDQAALQQKPGFDFNGLMDGISNYGIPAINIARGMFEQPYQQNHVTAITNPYKQDILNNLPKNIDYSSIVNQIKLNSKVANNDLLNNTNNSSVYRANRQNLAANTSRQLTNAQLQAQEANNGIAVQRGSIYGQLGNQDMMEQGRVREYNLGIDQMNTQTRGVQQNLLNTGISQLQQAFQNTKANKRKAAMDKYSLDILKQVYPITKYYNVFNPQ